MYALGRLLRLKMVEIGALKRYHPRYQRCEPQCKADLNPFMLVKMWDILIKFGGLVILKNIMWFSAKYE